MLHSAEIAVFTQQIGHYHSARFKAALPLFKRLTVVSTMNAAEFDQFLNSDLKDISALLLFDGRDSYLSAVRQGKIRQSVHRALDMLKPSVVAVAGWAFPESLSAISWAHQNGAKIIMMSDSQMHDAKRQTVREVIKSRVVKACDAALVAGRTHRDYIVDLGMPRESVFFGYDVVDNHHFAKGSDRARAEGNILRARLGLPERYILASARFIEKKSLAQLLRGFAQALKQAQTPHHLVILGDGPQRTLLEEVVTSTNLETRVIFVGFKDYHALPAYYGLAEGFVHVSRSEQWGLVINEAAAAGLPLVVSSVCGAATELVKRGVNGFLVEANNTDDIAASLIRLMCLTTKEREAMGRASRLIVACWGTERFAQGLQEASNAALSAPRRKLNNFDVTLLRLMSRKYFSAVS